MKKYYLLLTSLFLMAGTVCAQSFTDTTSNGIPLEYTVNSGTTTVTLTGHGSPCADTLNIPSMVIYNGLSYYVTIIGDSAFYDCIDLISVSIPNTVTHIDSLAFRGCTGLTTLIIPNSVTTIGNRAFLNCMNLESITIGNSVTSIGEWAFYYCSELNSLTIPNSVTTIVTISAHFKI